MSDLYWNPDGKYSTPYGFTGPPPQNSKKPKTKRNEKIVPVVPEKFGNNRQISPSKHWVFTVNNYTKEKIIMISSNSSIKRYSFQEEIGDSGTPHLQGYLEFITKRRPLNMFKDLGAHWIKCKNVKAAIAYTQKLDTRAGELYLKGIKKIRPLKILKEEQLYDWQREIVNIAKTEACDRLIHWFWEPKGCSGKTQLQKYLVVHHDALVVGGKSADMFFQVVSQEEHPDIILINLPHGSKMPDVKGIELVKDGLLASPKYESKMFIMNSPHIFIFANFEPIFPDDEYNLKKRWIIKEL